MRHGCIRTPTVPSYSFIQKPPKTIVHFSRRCFWRPKNTNPLSLIAQSKPTRSVSIGAFHNLLGKRSVHRATSQQMELIELIEPMEQTDFVTHVRSHPQYPRTTKHAPTCMHTRHAEMQHTRGRQQTTIDAHTPHIPMPIVTGEEGTECVGAGFVRSTRHSRKHVCYRELRHVGSSRNHPARRNK